MPTFQAVIFDLDGVIIDSEPLHEEAIRRVFVANNLAVPPTIYGTFKGQTDRDVLRHAIDTYSNGPLNVEALIQQKHAAYAALLDQLTLIPGAKDCIETLARQGMPLALTTSSAKTNQQRAFSRFNLSPYFSVVITADDITHPKPDPQPYMRTVEALGVAASESVVLEDSYSGVLSAVRAGCTVVGLTTSFPAEKLHAAGAHYVVDTFQEIAMLLEL